MAKAGAHKVLVAAGDYDIIYHTQQALKGENLALQRAFTHRDTLYALEHSRFDTVMVDTAMFDRYSGEVTIHTLSGIKRPLSVVAFDLSGNGTELGGGKVAAVVTELDNSVILQAVRMALGLEQRDRADFLPQTAQLPVSGEVLSRRIDELRTLFVLSQSLTEVLDLTEVLNRVVEAARHLTNADEGMILLPDDEAGQLYLRAKVGIDVEVARNFRIKTQDTLAGQVFYTGRPTLIGDQGPQKVKTEYFVNSLLYVPILLNGKPVGVLGVNNKSKEDIFNLDHQELLMNLASFTAIAIENARIHEESLQRNRELETLVEVSQVLNSTISLRETLPNICRQLVHVLKINLSEIYQWSPDEQSLLLLARYGRAMWPFGRGPKVPLAQLPAVSSALQKNRPYWVTADVEGQEEEKDYIASLGAGAMLLAPVYSRDRTLGVLRVFYIETPSRMPGSDVIQNILHLALEGLFTVLSQSQQNTAQTVFQSLTNINRMTQADWCDLAVITNDGDILSVHSEAGDGVWLDGPFRSINLSQNPDLLSSVESQLLLNQRPNSGSLTPGGRTLLDATCGQALLALPLIQRGQTVGLVLLADTERNRVFSPRDINMARAVVGQAATALENANLVRDLEYSLQELKDTQDRLVETARLSAMGELAAVVAHQINNPLTTIVVDTELMLLDEQEGTRRHETMMAIYRAGKRAAGVAKRLLAISRPNDPNIPPEPIDVVGTVEGILSLVKNHIERDRIHVLEKLPGEPIPSVLAIKGQLDDVWLNLLMNAHDALVGTQDATIGIEVIHVPEDGVIEVEVWDNGPGIPEKIIHNIFNPFFTTKPVGEGTGLGLHVCRQVVERTGGKIWVESEIGKGTRFVARLPVFRPEPI